MKKESAEAIQTKVMELREFVRGLIPEAADISIYMDANSVQFEAKIWGEAGEDNNFSGVPRYYVTWLSYYPESGWSDESKRQNAYLRRIGLLLTEGEELAKNV